LKIREIIDGVIASYLLPPAYSGGSSYQGLLTSAKFILNYSLQSAVENLLLLGKRYNHKFTIFVTGGLSNKNPSLIDKLLHDGHEIGSHSMDHFMSSRLSDEQFEMQAVSSKEALESHGANIFGYRAPYLSIPDRQYRILQKAGYTYSSSKEWDHDPICVTSKDGMLWEYPVTFMDWSYVHYEKSVDKMTLLLKSAMRHKAVFLFHPYFLGDRKYNSIWEEIFRSPDALRSACLNDQTLEHTTRPSQNIYITFDFGA